MITWTLEERRVNELTPFDKNPRQLTRAQEKQLRESIDRFGMVEKPVINRDGTIIGGHQRISLYSDETIRCWVPDRLLNESELQELCIRLNRNTGEWDWDKLANEWEVDHLVEWGFDEKDLFDDPKPKSGKGKYQVVIEATSREELDQLEEKVKSHLPEAEYKLKIKEPKV